MTLRRLGLVALLLLTAAQARAQAAAVSLACPRRAAPGQPFTVELLVDVATDSLGAYDTDLDYDPAVLAVVGMEGGTTPEFMTGSLNPITDPATFTSGATPVIGLQTSLTGPTGIVSVARITMTSYRPTSYRPTKRRTIAPRVYEIVDTAANELPVASVQGCDVCIGSRHPCPR